MGQRQSSGRSVGYLWAISLPARLGVCTEDVVKLKSNTQTSCSKKRPLSHRRSGRTIFYPSHLSGTRRRGGGGLCGLFTFSRGCLVLESAHMCATVCLFSQSRCVYSALLRCSIAVICFQKQVQIKVYYIILKKNP